MVNTHNDICVLDFTSQCTIYPTEFDILGFCAFHQVNELSPMCKSYSIIYILRLSWKLNVLLTVRFEKQNITILSVTLRFTIYVFPVSPATFTR